MGGRRRLVIGAKVSLSDMGGGGGSRVLGVLRGGNTVSEGSVTGRVKLAPTTIAVLYGSVVRTRVVLRGNRVGRRGETNHGGILISVGCSFGCVMSMGVRTMSADVAIAGVEKGILIRAGMRAQASVRPRLFLRRLTGRVGLRL